MWISFGDSARLRALEKQRTFRLPTAKTTVIWIVLPRHRRCGCVQSNRDTLTEERRSSLPSWVLYTSGSQTELAQQRAVAFIMFRIVFWDVLPCKMIVDRRFRAAYCFRHPWWIVLEFLDCSYFLLVYDVLMWLLLLKIGGYMMC
jgi:hypothetical protein